MNVRAAIREQADRLPGCSPAAISAAVLKALPDRELRGALSTALPYLVRDEVRKTRHHALGVADERGPYAWKEPEPELIPANALTGARRRAAARKASDAAQAKLARTAAFLATGVAVNGVWKALGDCTPHDLRILAAENARHATENTARANGYARLADDMERQGIARIRDYEEVERAREAFAAAA